MPSIWAPFSLLSALILGLVVTDVASAASSATRDRSLSNRRARKIQGRATLPSGWSYSGCVQDGGNRLLGGSSTTSYSLTIEGCISYCFSGGFSYAAVEYSSQCYCGNTINPTLGQSLAESSCNYQCSGNSAELCGGFYTASLYHYIAPVTQTSTWNYVGCFSDNGGTRLLPAEYDSGSMTPAVCSSYCQSQGYRYSGTEYSYQCFCGNTLDTTRAISASQCNYQCAGSSSATCGGSYAIGVYSYGAAITATSTTSSTSNTKSSMTTTTTTKTAPTPTSTATTWNFLGCFSDSSPRTLGAVAEYDDNSMTPALCQAHCLSLGYSYAGVEYYNQCFCGNTLDTSRAVSSASCNTACYGDGSKVCGGSWAMDIYQLSAAPSPTTTSISTSKASSSSSTSLSTTPSSTPSAVAGWSAVGCFGDANRVLAVEYDNGGLTPAICQTYCKNNGYAYAGVEYGYQCFCGNSMASSVSSTGCTMGCAGDGSQTCGGNYAIYVYKYGTTTSTTATSTSSSSSSSSTAQSPTFSIAAVTGVATPPSSSGTKALYAHHIVGNTYNYAYSTWQTDVSMAAAAGISGFALNLGSTTGTQATNIGWAYQAANAQGGFQNFLSFDFTAVSCNSAADGQAMATLINAYSSNAAQVVYKSKTLVSSFAGDQCTFGQGNTLAGFNYVRGLLTKPMYFVPAIFIDPSTFAQSAQAWFDGELNWNSGWPSGSGNLDTSSDSNYMSNLGSKGYMPAVSPSFFTYYACGSGAGQWCKDFIYRSDNWLLATRMEQLISFRNSVDFAELISWNDFGESHYVGNLATGGDLALSSGWTSGMPHTAWLKVLAYYAPAFKTGSYPSVSDLMVFWSRPHPKGANPTSPSVGRPQRADDTDDNLYVWVTLTTAASVTIYSGANTYTWSLPAGPSKLSIASAAGAIGGKIVRGGSTIKSYDSTGSFTYVLQPTDYNFNYFVSST